MLRLFYFPKPDSDSAANSSFAIAASSASHQSVRGLASSRRGTNTERASRTFLALRLWGRQGQPEPEPVRLRLSGSAISGLGSAKNASHTLRKLSAMVRFLNRDLRALPPGRDARRRRGSPSVGEWSTEVTFVGSEVPLRGNRYAEVAKPTFRLWRRDAAFRGRAGDRAGAARSSFRR